MNVIGAVNVICIGKTYQTDTSVVDVMCRPVLSFIGSSVFVGGVKSTITKSEVLLAFLPTKS